MKTQPVKEYIPPVKPNRERLSANPDTVSSHSKEELMLEIQSLNNEINAADEQIAFHHLEREKYEERKKKLGEAHLFFKNELHRKMGEVIK